MIGVSVGLGLGVSVTVMRIYSIVQAFENGTVTTWYIFLMTAESGLAITGGKLIGTTLATIGRGLIDGGREMERNPR